MYAYSIFLFFTELALIDNILFLIILKLSSRLIKIIIEKLLHTYHKIIADFELGTTFSLNISSKD